MPFFIASMYRVLPLIVALIAVAAIVFVLVFTSKGLDKAKEVMLKMFWWLSAVASVLFLLITLYAVMDGNENLAWFFASCLAVFLIAWGIDYICLIRFRKSHHNHEFFKLRFKTKEERAASKRSFADEVEFEVQNVASDSADAADSADSDKAGEAGEPGASGASSASGGSGASGESGASGPQDSER